MEAPKCFHCGTRHWSTEDCPAGKPDAVNTPDYAVNTPPEPPKIVANRPKQRKRNPAPALDAVNAECQSPTGGIPGYMVRQRYKDADRRREYLRVWMRRKREAERAAK